MSFELRKEYKICEKKTTEDYWKSIKRRYYKNNHLNEHFCYWHMDWIHFQTIYISTIQFFPIFIRKVPFRCIKFTRLIFPSIIFTYLFQMFADYYPRRITLQDITTSQEFIYRELRITRLDSFKYTHKLILRISTRSVSFRRLIELIFKDFR